MPSMPWCKWFPSKWLSSETRIRMTLAERSIYRDLLDFNYEKGSLPSDVRMLAQLAGASQDEFDKAWLVVGKHFVPCANDPSRITNPVVAAEIAQREKRSRARAGKHKSNDYTPPESNDTDLVVSNDTQIKTKTKIKTQRESAGPIVSDPLKACFDRVAAAYPNCTGYDDAFRIWMGYCESGIATEDNCHEVEEGLQRYIDSDLWARDGGRYIVSFYRWLMDKKWKDRPKSSAEAEARGRSAKKSSAGNDAYAEYIPEWEQKS